MSGAPHERSRPRNAERSTIRDRGCVFPGCDRPPGWCDGHHIVHWADGGPTDLANLALLCHHHHKAIHEGGWSMARAPDGTLTFTRPDGTPLQREHAVHRDRDADDDERRADDAPRATKDARAAQSLLRGRRGWRPPRARRRSGVATPWSADGGERGRTERGVDQQRERDRDEARLPSTERRFGLRRARRQVVHADDRDHDARRRGGTSTCSMSSRSSRPLGDARRARSSTAK